MSYIVRFFTWWNKATLSTGLWTMLYGEKVGTDEFGNVYYRRRGGKKDKALGFERRWVIFNGYCEGSAIPQGWYGWKSALTSPSIRCLVLWPTAPCRWVWWS